MISIHVIFLEYSDTTSECLSADPRGSVFRFAQESAAAQTLAVRTHSEKNQVEEVMIVEYFAHSSAVGSEWTVAGLQGQEGEQMAARRREDGRKRRPHLEGMAYPDDIHRAHVAESQFHVSFPDDSLSMLK